MFIKEITSKFHKQRNTELVFLLQGQDRGYAAWYYIKFADKLKLTLFKKRIETDRGEVPIEEYGEILKSGWGIEPPEHIKEKIEEEYLK